MCHFTTIDKVASYEIGTVVDCTDLDISTELQHDNWMMSAVQMRLWKINYCDKSRGAS